MSKLDLRLQVGSTWITAHASARAGLLSRTGTVDARANTVRAATPTGLQDALEAIAADLLAHGVSFRGGRLQVEIGMRDARLGVLRMTSPDQRPVPSALLRTYVEGSVRQMLHLDPGEQVLRWRVLRDPRHVLVSCVDRSSLAALTQFAAAHELRFTSCIPAAMLSVRQGRRLGARTLLWTEGVGGRRDEALQVFRFEHGHPVAAWRGWAPAREPAAASDRELQEALRRFQAVHAPGVADEALHTHWPLPAALAANE